MEGCDASGSLLCAAEVLLDQGAPQEGLEGPGYYLSAMEVATVDSSSVKGCDAGGSLLRMVEVVLGKGAPEEGLAAQTGAAIPHGLCG